MHFQFQWFILVRLSWRNYATHNRLFVYVCRVVSCVLNIFFFFRVIQRNVKERRRKKVSSLINKQVATRFIISQNQQFISNVYSSANSVLTLHSFRTIETTSTILNTNNTERHIYYRALCVCCGLSMKISQNIRFVCSWSLLYLFIFRFVSNCYFLSFFCFYFVVLFLFFIFVIWNHTRMVRTV